MKLTRHNGRSGKNGVYSPKHNDRNFDIENSYHIDAARAFYNVYWDCYNGIRSPNFGSSQEELEVTFEEVEREFYKIHYQGYIDGQTKRNRKNRHPERDRTTDDIRKNNKTCPEESVYQIGTLEEHVDSKTLMPVVTEFITELNERFGEYIHVLDWALHMDESTPHIHERHVFDCENEYGEIFPQQEKSLELLGFELPYPDRKPGRYNNRKMNFDAACRALLFDICKNHGLHLDEEPTYGGRAYLEKQDYIRMKQKEQIQEQAGLLQLQQEKMAAREEILGKQEESFLNNSKALLSQEAMIEEKEQKLEELTLKIADVDTLIDEVSAIAYDKAVEAVTDEVIVQSHKTDIELIEGTKTWIQDPDRTASKKEKQYALARLDGVIKKIESVMTSSLNRIKKRLLQPETKKQVVEQIRTAARPSVLDRLRKKQENISSRESNRDAQKTQPNKKRDMSI